MKRILSFLILFVSVTASSFAVAESTFNEDLAYFLSRMPSMKNDNNTRGLLRSLSKKGRTNFTREEVDRATKLTFSVFFDCVKYTYINTPMDRNDRNKIKGSIKFLADVLRNDQHGEYFQGGGALQRVIIQDFLKSKYSDLKNEEEMYEKFESDYGIDKDDLESVDFSFMGRKNIENEYCLNNKKIMHEKLSEMLEE